MQLSKQMLWAPTSRSRDQIYKLVVRKHEAKDLFPAT